MNRIWGIVLGLTILGSFDCERANSQQPPARPDGSNAGPCNESKKVARVRQSVNSTGETVEGPACVEVGAVNTLRYFVTVTMTATQTAGPSPSSIFPSSGNNNAGAGGGSADLDALQGRVRRLQTDVRARQDDNRAAAAKLDELIARLKEFVSHSDESVGSGQFGTLISRISALKTEIDHTTQTSAWKASDDLLKSVHLVQNDWGNLRVDHPAVFNDAATQKQNTDIYNALKTQLADLETQALSQASGSDPAKAVGKDLGLLMYWSNVFGGFLNPDGSVPQDPATRFTLHQTVACGNIFNFNKQVAVKLMVGDRLPFFDGQQMSTQTRDAFVTVTCGSPFSLSAGVGLSFVQQREFAIVQSATAPGATTTVNKFGYSSLSSVNPVPLAMAHLRIVDWGDHRYAVHASFGVAANVQGTNSGGSSAGYVPGISLSLFRTMYITGAAYIGKQGSLAGGFKVGDVVPTNITTPPVQSSYKAGFGLAITFTKP
jgi:hypothetical protein